MQSKLRELYLCTFRNTCTERKREIRLNFRKQITGILSEVVESAASGFDSRGLSSRWPSFENSGRRHGENLVLQRVHYRCLCCFLLSGGPCLAVTLIPGKPAVFLRCSVVEQQPWGGTYVCAGILWCKNGGNATLVGFRRIGLNARDVASSCDPQTTQKVPWCSPAAGLSIHKILPSKLLLQFHCS